MNVKHHTQCILGSLLLTLVVGAGTYLITTAKTPKPVTYEKVAAFNCGYSGGEFSNNFCSCPKDNTFNADIGYCITPFGLPGGDMGVLQELMADSIFN